MMASRGMGDISSSKVPKGKKGGEVWDKPRPAGLGKSKKLSPAKKSSAKAMAKAMMEDEKVIGLPAIKRRTRK